MNWTIRLDAKTTTGEVTSYEIGGLRRKLFDPSADSRCRASPKPRGAIGRAAAATFEVSKHMDAFEAGAGQPRKGVSPESGFRWLVSVEKDALKAQGKEKRWDKTAAEEKSPGSKSGANQPGRKSGH